MRYSLLFVVFVILVMLMPLSGCDIVMNPMYPDDMQELTIMNNTINDYFTELYIARSDLETWGENRLYYDLEPGHSYRDYLHQGTYDIKVVTYYGYEYTKYNVELYGNRTVFLPY